MLNKTCKYHKLVFVTELIFGDNPKSHSKISETFSQDNQCDATFHVRLLIHRFTTLLEHIYANTVISAIDQCGQIISAH